MAKKILIVVTKGEIGGAQVFVKNLATGLLKMGIDVTVALGLEHGSYLEPELLKIGAKIHTFYNLSRSFSPLRNFFLILEARKYFNNNRFDAIQLNSSNSIFIAAAAKISKFKPKIIFTHHGLSFIDPSAQNLFKKFALKTVFVPLIRLVDINIFVSRRNFDEATHMKLVSKEKSVVIYNGIYPEFKTKSESVKFLESALNTPLKGVKIIGSIGRLAHPKNFEFFINSAKLITQKLIASDINPVYIIIGNGPEKERYISIIRKNGLYENFFILSDINNASKYIKAFDLFVLTSIYEGLPLTAIEAISAGIPVLLSDIGGNPEIIGRDETQLFKLNNKIEFCEKAISIIKDRTLHSILSRRNKEGSNKFFGDLMVSQYFNLI